MQKNWPTPIKKNWYMSGSHAYEIMFKNTSNMTEKLQTVVENLGLFPGRKG